MCRPHGVVMSGRGHRGINLWGTDLGGVSVHSAGLVKTSSGDVSSLLSSNEWGRPPWR